MNKAHRKTLTAIFERPIPATIRWSEIEALVIALGGVVLEREGSRVALVLNDIRAVFHRPHPLPATKRGAVKAVRTFLVNAGVKP